ncbi:MAG: hypothetical protein Q8O32_01535 [bacterium]|nr:hypothetical protein [bacterium]
MANTFETIQDPLIEQEGAIDVEEAIELAEEALENLEDSQERGADFPGADAYRKVMRVVVMAKANNKVITDWQSGYEELAAKYSGQDRKEFLAENNPRSMLEGALASAKRKISEQKEKE